MGCPVHDPRPSDLATVPSPSRTGYRSVRTSTRTIPRCRLRKRLALPIAVRHPVLGQTPPRAVLVRAGHCLRCRPPGQRLHRVPCQDLLQRTQHHVRNVQTGPAQPDQGLGRRAPRQLEPRPQGNAKLQRRRVVHQPGR
uniref:(northern house mosquito) hypothetical protein n=1 Tax=Culex pipiens TaxID=7175 RepID=A0A8D7ZVR8_CULPI